MRVIPVQTPLIKPREDAVTIILNQIRRLGEKMEERDVLAVASKVIATSQGRLVDLGEVEPSSEARRLSKVYDLEPEFVEVILRESDQIYGGVWRAILTLKRDILIANGGADRSNSPYGTAVLWPLDPDREAESIRQRVLSEFGKKVGVIVIDSRTAPMRMGTIGVAIGVSGFRPVRDYRGEKDLYGRELRITRSAVADDLASVAHLVMGESAESIPAVLIKGAPIELADTIDPEAAVISPEQCLFMKIFRPRPLKIKARADISSEEPPIAGPVKKMIEKE